MYNQNTIKLVSFISLGSFIFFFYITFIGFDGILNSAYQNSTATVLGISTEEQTEPAKSSSSSPKLMVNNSKPGEAYLELHLSRPVDLDVLQGYFELTDGNLKVSSIECAEGFRCVQNEQEGDTFSLAIIDQEYRAGQKLNGVVRVATIRYSPRTYGELIYNSSDLPATRLVEEGPSDNLLSTEEGYLAIGQPY